MDSKTGRGKTNFRLSRKKRKDDRCPKCGCCSASGCQDKEDTEDYQNIGDTKKDFEIKHHLRSYAFLDKRGFFEALLTEMQVSESESSDPLIIVDQVKGLLSDLEEVATSGLPATDSYDLSPKYCEFIEKFSQLDDMVNRIERLFSRVTVGNLTKLLDDCQKTLRGIQVGLKKLGYIGTKERHMIEAMSTKNEVFRINDSMIDQNMKLLDLIENVIPKRKKNPRTRRNSW